MTSPDSASCTCNAISGSTRWSGAPYVDHSDRTYTDAERPLRHRLSYQWNHSIGEIVTALIRNGLRLEWLAEHDWTVWPRWDWLVRRDDGTWVTPPGPARAPLTFNLIASRPG